MKWEKVRKRQRRKRKRKDWKRLKREKEKEKEKFHGLISIHGISSDSRSARSRSGLWARTSTGRFIHFTSALECLTDRFSNKKNDKSEVRKEKKKKGFMTVWNTAKFKGFSAFGVGSGPTRSLRFTGLKWISGQTSAGSGLSGIRAVSGNHASDW